MVADFLRNDVQPRLDGRVAFHVRVAANALDIVRRELEVGPEADRLERQMLQDLLGQDGTLEELNGALAQRIRDGALGLDSPGLADALWQMTMTKLSIDQPTYSAYRRSIAEQGQAGSAGSGELPAVDRQDKAL